MNTGLAYKMTYKAHSSAILLALFSFNCWAAEQISDPTMPAHYKVNRVSNGTNEAIVPAQYEWVLNSTLISPHLEVAIINGKQLKIGDEINGAILKKIDHQKVTLQYEKETITLLLHHSFISQINSTVRP